MRQIGIALLLTTLALLRPVVQRAEAQFPPQVKIDSPRPGEAVQGVVPVRGSTAVDGFVRYELAFAFEGDETQTWFVIAQSSEPVTNGTLGEWDTTTLTDGSYSLRLIVSVEGGSPEVAQVEGLRVRNYSPIETNTPAPTHTPDPGQTATPTDTPLPPTPTDLPANPAEIGPRDVRTAVIGGIIGAAALFGLLGLYARARSGRRG